MASRPGELAPAAHDLQALRAGDGEARRVVPAVFELLQATDEERRRLPRSDVSNNPTHPGSEFYRNCRPFARVVRGWVISPSLFVQEARVAGVLGIEATMDESREGSRQAERARPTNINVIFSLTVLPHEKALLRRARRLVGHEADARDLVQETLERALRTFHAFRPGTAVWAWLRTIMNSVWIDGWRRRQAAAKICHLPSIDLAAYEPEAPAVGRGPTRRSWSACPPRSRSSRRSSAKCSSFACRPTARTARSPSCSASRRARSARASCGRAGSCARFLEEQIADDGGGGAGPEAPRYRSEARGAAACAI